MIGFFLGVAQTAIGATLGFLLGLLAFRHQQRLQSAAEAKKDWEATLDALNRLTTTAVTNLESLANFKLQLISDLRPEVVDMKAASKEAFEELSNGGTEKISALLKLSGSMRQFYMSFPKISIMSPPNYREYSSLSMDMPALSLFVHRAMGTMEELNGRIQSRNARIAEQARESGAGGGLPAERVRYYSSMLADEGMAICKVADFALNFWRLVLEQVGAYGRANAKGGHFIKYQLLPEAAEALPQDELFPKLREQLVLFDEEEAIDKQQA